MWSRDRKIRNLEIDIAKIEVKIKTIVKDMERDDFEERLRLKGLETKDVEAYLVTLSERKNKKGRRLTKLRSKRVEEVSYYLW